MKKFKKYGVLIMGIMFLCVASNTSVLAGGPPLKDNACGACHKDYSAITPKGHPDVDKKAPCLSCHTAGPTKNEPTKFSTEIHKLHQGGKTKQECSACHAL